MKTKTKTGIAGLVLTGVVGAFLFHGKVANATTSKVPFTFKTVDAPVTGAGSTMVVGINNLGDIVGSYNFIPGAAALGLPSGFLGKGFVWYKNGKFSTIAGPGPVNPQNCNPAQGLLTDCYYMEARGINDLGDIVGTYSQDVLNPDGGLFRAFFQRAGGQFTSYLVPGHDNSIFEKITDTDVIYGCFHDQGIDNSSQASMHGVIDLLAPNNKVLGLSSNSTGSTMNVGGGLLALQYAGVFYDFTEQRHRAFVVNAGRQTDFDMPGSNMTYAWDMDVEGDVVGVWGNNPNPIIIDGIPFHGFMRDRTGKFIDIDYPGSIDTHVFGINDLGTIVGSYVDAGYNIHGFIAVPGDQRARLRSPGHTIVNASYSTSNNSQDPVVAMMSVVPNDKPLMPAAKGAPACHQIHGK
jgi:hypothetical protein